jgi:integrase
MSRKIEMLTDKTLRGQVARAIAAGVEARFPDGGGLTLVVTPAGRARFVHVYTYKGRRPERWLEGVYPNGISLTEARRQRREDRDLLEAGKDPLAVGEVRTLEPTFLEFCRANYKRLAPPTQRALAVDDTRWFKDMRDRVGPVARMKIDQIGLTDVARSLRRFWDGDRAQPTARHLSDAIKRVLELRHVQERPEDVTWHNPIVFARLKKINGDASHTSRPRKSLRHRDAPAYMVRLRAMDDVSARLLEFIILSGCRLNEARLATWEQINWRRREWVIPGEVRKTERHKRGRDAKAFVVPLSLGMVQCLRRAARHMPCQPGDFIFPSYRKRKAGPYSRMQPLHVAQQAWADEHPDITVHGFRSTLTAWGIALGHQRRGPFARDVLDACLAHAIKYGDNGVKLSDASGNYGHDDERDPYLDRRRAVMRAWSMYLSAPKVDQPPAAKVVPATAENVTAFPALRRAA